VCLSVVATPAIAIMAREITRQDGGYPC